MELRLNPALGPEWFRYLMKQEGFAPFLAAVEDFPRQRRAIEAAPESPERAQALAACDLAERTIIPALTQFLQGMCSDPWATLGKVDTRNVGNQPGRDSANGDRTCADGDIPGRRRPARVGGCCVRMPASSCRKLLTLPCGGGTGPRQATGGPWKLSANKPSMGRTKATGGATHAERLDPVATAGKLDPRKCRLPLANWTRCSRRTHKGYRLWSRLVWKRGCAPWRKGTVSIPNTSWAWRVANFDGQMIRHCSGQSGTGSAPPWWKMSGNCTGE